MEDLQNMQTRILLQIQTLFPKSNPGPVKYVLFFQLCAFLLALITPICNLLVLVPSNLFQLHLWRVVTNILVENNILLLAWSAYCCYQFLMFIQPNWPLEETVKYAIIVQLGSTLCLVISALLLYVLTGFVYPFYHAQIYGSAPIAMAALVASKQYIPDTVFLCTPLGRVKNGHLPMASIAFSMLLCLFGLLRDSVLFQLIFSIQISWTYLRFFQSRGGHGEQMVGDRSEHFSWASLFPRRIQPAATLLGRLTFRTLHRLGILRRVMYREHLDYMEEQTLQAEALQSVQVAASADTAVLAPEGWDAERKRQKALRMLNERLALANLQSSPRTTARQQQQIIVPDTRDDDRPPCTIPQQLAPSSTAVLSEGGEQAVPSAAEVQFYLDQRSSSEKSASQEPPAMPVPDQSNNND